MECPRIESSFKENRYTAEIFVLVEGEKCCSIILKRKSVNTGYAAIDFYETTTKLVAFIKIMNFLFLII
jgi:hypothetical protein